MPSPRNKKLKLTYREQPTLTLALTPGARPAGPALDLSAVRGFTDGLDVPKAIQETCTPSGTCDQLTSQARRWTPAHKCTSMQQIYSRRTTALQQRTRRCAPSSPGCGVSFSPLTLKLTAAGRLILSLPSGPFFEDMQSATLSPSLALLIPFDAAYVASAARRARTAPSDPQFWYALSAGAGDGAALRGGFSDAPAGTPGVVAGDVVLQALVRKPTGGAKAMQRGLAGFRKRPAAGAGSSTRGSRSQSQSPPRWDVFDIESVVPTPLAAARAGTTHADLALPFNLSLTDAQRAQRGAVPLPYAHEGEGADVRMGMDWSDDEEDDEV